MANRPEGSVARRLRAGVAAAIVAATVGVALAQDVKVTLSGDQEIPPVATAGSGTGIFTVAPDGTASGSVTIVGVKVTVAHIHEAPAGRNGPIVVPLVKTSESTWAVPPGTKLSDAQFAAFRAGHLYYNIHSEAWKAGEVRGQIRP
jgi:hypothetical protein